MGYVKDGTKRSLTITLDKWISGQHESGYPRTYDGKEVGTNWGQVEGAYAAITATEMAQLSDADFALRYNAWVDYLKTFEGINDFSGSIVGDGATKNAPECVVTITVEQFAIKYADSPAGACDGTLAVVYADTASPNDGDILYTDESLNTPFSLGAYIVFATPALYSPKVVTVSTVSSTNYSQGEIIDTINGYDCSSAPSISPKMKVTHWSSDGVLSSNLLQEESVDMTSTGASSQTAYTSSVGVQNTGVGDLIVTSVSEIDDGGGLFTLNVSGLPWTIPQNNTNGFTVTFNSAAANVTAGTYSAAYQINSNDSANPIFEFQIHITVG